MLHENVAAAREDIVASINAIAGKIRRSMTVIFNDVKSSRPKIEASRSDDEPAVVTVSIGGETIAARVFGDAGGEIKLEMSQRLSDVLGLPVRTKASTVEQVDVKLGQVASLIAQRLHR